MNKSDLVDVVVEEAQVSKSVAERVLNEILESMTRALKKGESVSLVGFGTLAVRHRKARKGRNPKTGAPLQIAASQVVGFKSGKSLKDAVQRK